jgi:hypothetical protein
MFPLNAVQPSFAVSPVIVASKSAAKQRWYNIVKSLGNLLQYDDIHLKNEHKPGQSPRRNHKKFPKLNPS